MVKINSILIIVILFYLNNFLEAQTWVRKNAGYGFWSIQKDYAGNIYAGTTGTPRGIFKSTDGGETWTNVYSTGASNYLDIAFDQLNNVYVANGSNGLIISTDGGSTFTTIPTSTFGGNSVNTVVCGDNGLVLVGVTSGGVYRSTDYGATFTQTLSGYSIVSLEFDKFNPNRVYAGSSSTTLNGFFVSTDGGQTFTGPTNSVNVWEILQLKDSSLITVSTSAGYPVNKSTDLGLTWTTVGNTPAAIRGACLDLLENIYAAGNGGVYKSTDGGATFTNFNLTYSSNKIISFQNKILVAVSGTTNGGVYVYTDETLPVELSSFTVSLIENNISLSWTTVTETNNYGFEIQRQQSIKQSSVNKWEKIGFVPGFGTTTEPKHYSFIDKNLIAGTYKYRLKQIDFDGKVSYSDEIKIDFIPEGFELKQNYPNPFNPVTKIVYSINQPTRVKLYVSNLLGQTIEELVNELKEPGIYEVTFDGKNLTSGLYFYSLETPFGKISKKMLYLK
ncbi:MAG: T9SS type A sorting domain-containing protein [Ignavibacterium sp.]|uniref:T9SS type A sorting domain-containing protein n=1 Tax=Ignavibacterium sp. TaxID=2651167 RepID=UPI0040498DF6